MDLLSTGQQQQQGIDKASGQQQQNVGGGLIASDGMMSKPSLISSLWSIQVQNEGSASDFPMGDCGSQQSLPELLNQTCSSSNAVVSPFHHHNCNGFAGGAGAGHIEQQQIQFNLGGTGGSGGIPIPMDAQPGPMVMMASNAGAAAMPYYNMAAASCSTSLRPVKSLSDLHTLTAAQIAQTAAAMPYPHHHQNVPPSNEQQHIYQGTVRRQTETSGTFYDMLSRQQRDFQICEWLQKLNVAGAGGAETTSGSESPSQEFYPQQRPPFHRADTTEQ